MRNEEHAERDPRMPPDCYRKEDRGGDNERKNQPAPHAIRSMHSAARFNPTSASQKMPNERIHPVSSRTSSAASKRYERDDDETLKRPIRRSRVKLQPAKHFGEQPVHEVSQQTSEPDRYRREQQTEHAPRPRFDNAEETAREENAADPENQPP